MTGHLMIQPLKGVSLIPKYVNMKNAVPANPLEQFVSPIHEKVEKRFNEVEKELEKLYEKSKSHDRTSRTLAE